MHLLLSLLKCAFIAAALFSAGMTTAVTMTVASGLQPGDWTVLTLPLPFGPIAALGCLSLALSCASNE